MKSHEVFSLTIKDSDQKLVSGRLIGKFLNIWKLNTFVNQIQQALSVKGQQVNISGFAGHRISAASILTLLFQHKTGQGQFITK